LISYFASFKKLSFLKCSGLKTVLLLSYFLIFIKCSYSRQISKAISFLLRELFGIAGFFYVKPAYLRKHIRGDHCINS
jgi:hypothetical protein